MHCHKVPFSSHSPKCRINAPNVLPGKETNSYGLFHNRDFFFFHSQSLRGVDLAPKDSVADEPIPKSVSRVLDSARITREFREKKRKLDDGDDGVRGKRRRQNDSHEGAEATLQIKPGETIAHFNK